MLSRAISAVMMGLMVSAACAASEPRPLRAFDGQSWWKHVQVLADDAMEGRQVGSAGLRKAQAYVIEEFKRAGLEPAGSDGFRQPVQFVQRDIDEEKSAAELTRDGTASPVEIGVDAFFSLRVPSAPGGVDAPLVFVGNGLRVPEVGLDDFAGVDLKGKIAVFIAGSPAAVSVPLTGHYSSAGERTKVLREAGAVGYIAIPNPSAMDVPWIRMTANRTAPAMDLADPSFGENTGMRLALTWNPAQAEKLFANSGHTFRELAILAKDRKPLPAFALNIGLRAHSVTRETRVECANLVARLPGSDPALKGEHVVLCAHLDHLGIGAAINGDRIYNGAMDNASGVALLLDLAAAWRAQPAAMRRSVLFVVVTAEEKGLLGSKFFARQPTVPAASLIAAINFDMFCPLYPLKLLKVAGIAESDLGEGASATAEKFGVSAQPDPEPLRNTFIRSDQYNFIKQGVPAVKIDFGYVMGTPEQKLATDWRTQRYHAPSDDLAQPVDIAAAGHYEEILREFVQRVANADARPQWKADSFFKRYAK